MVGKVKRGLLRHSKSITGKFRLLNSKSLKPQQTRQLIRRFHVLQKNRHLILVKLLQIKKLIDSKEKEQRNEEEKKEREAKVYDILKNNKQYKAAYDAFKCPSKYADCEVYKIDSTVQDESMLIKTLAKIDAEIEQRGGLSRYQIASTQGQTGKRGGDSSKKLVEWLRTDEYNTKLQNVTALEIGCLSTQNFITTSGIFSHIDRIDLNSQDPMILQQDFMKRDLPKSDKEKYNLISCSLVLNFVPSHEERGQMLKRITQFLKKPVASIDKSQQLRLLSSLFLVLPLPCVTNSRYLDKEHLLKIMKSLGFTQTFYHEAKKVAYWIFDWDGKIQKNASFTKKELHSGSNRNNFCITL